MINDYLAEKLTPKNLSLKEFSELLIRLLDYGVICRDESQVEEQLYDRFIQVESLVEEYLAVIAIRYDHNTQFKTIRIYPPGAIIPGKSDQDDQPFNSGFRTRLNQHEVAAVLVLRVEYDKSLREGEIDDNGAVMLSVEALALGLKNLLNRTLPESRTDRKQLFRKLRQLRLIQYNLDEELESDESWLKVLPTITGFVNDRVLEELLGPQEHTDQPPLKETLKQDDTALFSKESN